ncbi:hypothetical protein WH95_00485 [Kiloniella litopenaei]|uniref:Uncharacterized protein n=1 Tax=Kiloniella litopenaei TaxID=1549748 RepID=A0A0M2RGC0_9PROT|nr:hypothetical protein [Kiloniella litopenaei]KKJ78613.1 hypothetical protein WH95_00485 [Kiloniella litopenaei]
MPNIPDSRAPATVRFQLPDENIGTVTSGISRLAKAVHEKDQKEKKAAQEAAVDDIDRLESPEGEGFIEGVKSDLRDASDFMQEKLRDIDLYEEMSEFASGLYQGIKEQLGFTDSSPSKIDEEINSAYADMKTDQMARQNFKDEDEAAAFSQRFDEKARFDLQSLRAFKQQIIKEKIHTTVDRHIEKYGSGVVNNPDTLTDAIIVIDSNINDLAPGMGREAAVGKSREARKSLLTFALQGHAKQGNYEALQLLLDGVDPATGTAINIDEYVGSEDKGYFQSIASKGIVRNEATKLLDNIYSAGLSEEDLFRTLEYYPDQFVGEEAALLWRNERRLQAKEQRERLKGQRYSAWNYLVENKGNINVNDLSLDLAEIDRNQIAEYADQMNAVENDFSSDVKFRRVQGLRTLHKLKALQVADPEAFPDYDLSHYFKDLTPKQIGEVMAMQKNEPDPRAVASFKLRERLAQKTWEKITGRSGQEEFSRPDFVDFRIQLDERIDEYNGTHKEPAGPFEIEKIANNMVANGEVLQPVHGDEDNSFVDQTEDDSILLRSAQQERILDAVKKHEDSIVKDQSIEVANGQQERIVHAIQKSKNDQGGLSDYKKDDAIHNSAVSRFLTTWHEEPDKLNNSDPFLGTNKYIEDDIIRMKKMLSKHPTGEEKINFSIIKDVVSSGYNLNKKDNFDKALVTVYDAVEKELKSRKQHSTRFTGPRPLEHAEVAAIMGKLAVQGVISPPDISQQDFPGLDDITSAFFAGGVNVVGSAVSGVGDIIEAVDELAPGAIEASLFPALSPVIMMLNSGVISEEQFQKVIVPEVLSTFLEENQLGWMLDPSKALSKGLQDVGGEITNFSEYLKPDQQHWVTDLAYDTGEVLTKIGISSVSAPMMAVVAAGEGAHKQKIRAVNNQASAKEKSAAILTGAATGLAIEAIKVDKLVKALPEPAKKWFANRVIGNVIMISEKTGIPVDEIMKNQGTQLLTDAVEGGVNALIAGLYNDPNAEIWQGATENITNKTWLAGTLSPILTPKISSFVH